MKKALSAVLIVVLLAGTVFMAMPAPQAQAMNAEAAALLGAGLVLFGAPIVNAITSPWYAPSYGGYYAPYPAGQVYMGPSYAPPPAYRESCREVRVVDRYGYVVDRYYQCYRY